MGCHLQVMEFKVWSFNCFYTICNGSFGVCGIHSLEWWHSARYISYFCQLLSTFVRWQLTEWSTKSFIHPCALSDAGAKEAHVVSPHFAQFLYFGLVSAAALLPWHFTPTRASDLFHWCRKNKTYSSFAILVALGLSLVAVHLFRFVISFPLLCYFSPRNC